VSGTDPVEDALSAISHRGRRTMLRLAWSSERTSSELAEGAGLSRSAASQHLKILRDAGLMHVRVDANRRLYSVAPERLAALRAALEEFWGEHLDALKASAELVHRSRTATRRNTA
jgi:DNA-binding transcriptional ArsR family regulator